MTPLPKLQVTKSSLPPPVHSGPMILFCELHTKKNEEEEKARGRGKAEEDQDLISGKSLLTDKITTLFHQTNSTHCSHLNTICLCAE